MAAARRGRGDSGGGGGSDSDGGEQQAMLPPPLPLPLPPPPLPAPPAPLHLRRSRWSRDVWGRNLACRVAGVISTEVMERFSYYSVRAILVIYLTVGLSLSPAAAVAAYSVFNAGCDVSPLLGAYVADNWLGRVRTIVVFNVLYLAGSATLGATAFHPSMAGMVAGLTAMAVATGGIKACVAPLGAEQLAGARDRVSRAYFGAFYWAINLGSAVSYSVTPLIRAHAGFGPAFLTATAALAASLAVFLLPVYATAPVDPAGSACVKLARVTRAAWRARAACAAHCCARARPAAAAAAPAAPPPPWCACVEVARDAGGATAADVADVAAILRILALLSPMPVFWALFDAQGSVWTLQRVAMNNCAGDGVCLTPEQLGALNPLLVLLFVPLFDLAVLPSVTACARARGACACSRARCWPCVRRPRAPPPPASSPAPAASLPPPSLLLLPPSPVVGAAAAPAASAEESDDALAAASCCFPSRLRRMGVGMQLAAAAYVATAVVQAAIDVAPRGSVSFAWQLPQIVLITAAEVLVCTTGLEVAYHAAPVTLRSTVLSLYYCYKALGNVLTGVAYSSLAGVLSPAAIMASFAALMSLAGVAFAVLVYCHPDLPPPVHAAPAPTAPDAPGAPDAGKQQ